MPLSDPESAMQVKVFAEQVAAKVLGEYQPQIAQIERAVARLSSAMPEEGAAPISPVSKWLAGLAATITAGLIMAALLWVGSSVTDMQQTLARIDERQKAQTEAQNARFSDYDRRINRLERYHQVEGSGTP